MTGITGLRVWPKHLYSVPFQGRTGYCSQGSRIWFAAHGLSWSDFVANGIDADQLLATGDPMAISLVKHAQEQSHGQK